MRVLGIESSSLVASVALVTDDIMTAEYTVDFKKDRDEKRCGKIYRRSVP